MTVEVRIVVRNTDLVVDGPRVIRGVRDVREAHQVGRAILQEVRGWGTEYPSEDLGYNLRVV